MTVWFTSDLHFGHRKVAELRGYGDGPMSSYNHDADIVSTWDDQVEEGDHVWVLGDLAASSPTHALDTLLTLPGHKHLIAGNHDQCHPMHRDSHKHLRRYLEVFDSVQPFARRRIEGESVLLSHFPYRRDRDEPRFTQYRLADEGLWLLHGHTHGTEKLTISERELHVGWDAWRRLVSLDEVAQWLATGRQSRKVFEERVALRAGGNLDTDRRMISSRWAG